MSDQEKKPYGLHVDYLPTPTPSLLSKPYDLFVEYDYSAVGSDQSILADGFDSSEFGFSKLIWTRYLSAVGWSNASLYGSPSLYSRNKFVIPQSFNSLLVSKPIIYNLKQLAPIQGKDQSSYGTPYMQGGVRWVTARSIAPLGVGKPALLNTTANQNTRPIGISRTAVVPAPIVSPHMIYARGIYGTAFGSVKLIPTPVLSQKGLNHLVAGEPTVWFHTRPLTANGFESYATGYPRVFDPAQFIQQLPFNRTAVFGDTYAKNVWTFVKGAGAIDSQAISEWATLENKNRRYDAKGFLSQVFGSQLIANKSPSLFFSGLPAPIIQSPAIGYRIRKVSVVGFDKLQLGNPTVIKTPELFPRSYVATQFGVQWVSNYTRHIEHYGTNHSATGKPTVWFRWRYTSPNSWQSSKFGNSSTVTHGVREVIGRGFIQQAYGNAWVSAGVRVIKLTAIYKDHPSNHYIGRHQEIKPTGFIATRFGTRIIPSIQTVYPLGFVGVFGLAIADLYTKHLKAKGFATYGEQPAFRWGSQIVQNSVQYITQNYDSGNGLVPPKWSDYQSIENRNKKIGAIGTLMQRFGYSQIDNNARQLSPIGLLATRFNQSMVAYGTRYLPLQGIEPPYMSDWLVVHNSARVIAPKGSIQSIFGNAELVKTRRYFDRIGRIDSLDMGMAFISHRVRVIDVEKRYSIAPPIIRLPTIDLYTRYVDFRGYETAKYGLASLSIHFRIITPRWTHRDNAGEPAIRNATPELLAKGRDSQEYGVTIVRTEWRLINAQGDNTQLFGATKISDTKQYVSIRGWLSGLNSQKHIATKTGTNPYVTQNIWLNNESDSTQDGFGIPTDNRFFLEQVTKPFLNQNVLYVTGIDSFDAGVTGIHSNNIQVTAGISIDGVSKGARVYVLRQIIDITGSKKIDSEIVVSNPRVSPHTIWAVKEAPVQARLNHPTKDNLHYVGEVLIGGGKKSAGEIFGRASVEGSIRTIKPYWLEPSSFRTIGRPTLDLKTKVIAPDGFRQPRFGIPSIPFTLQSIVIRSGINEDSFNRISGKIENAPYLGAREIKTKGLDSLVVGLQYADNLDRTLSAVGRDSLVMGARKQNDTPFMWQGLRVGERVPIIISAGDTSLFGNTVIGLRVRELALNGFVAFRSGYNLESFEGRMTVINANKMLPAVNNIAVSGIESNNTIGYQDIKHGQRYIRPDGNSDQFRKGGYYA